MVLTIAILWIVLGSVLLYYGAEYLVKGAVMLAKMAGISTLVIGLTVVAAGTSAPELVVSVTSAVQGNADVSLGNVIGSNICNIGLILGLCAMVCPMAASASVLKFDVPFMIGISILFPTLYYSFGCLNRIAGIVFLILMIWYLYRSVKQGKKETDGDTVETKTEEKTGIVASHPLPFAILSGMGGIAALVTGAKLFVDGSVSIARMIGVSDAVIALTLVAVGTSLPELATSLIAAFHKENDIAIGNVVGSNIFNILVILGITPLICPVRGQDITPWDLAVMLYFAILLFLQLLLGKNRIGRFSGAVQFLSYAGYMTWLGWKTLH